MLLLTFWADEDRYALPAGLVREIVPLVVFREIHGAPDSVAGLMNYRGVVAPAVDLTALLAGRRFKPLYSTRIVLIDHPGADGEKHVLGLVAERATETVSCRPADIKLAGIEVPAAPFLRGVLTDRQGMIQLTDPLRILPEELRKSLFTEADRSADAS